MNSYEFFLFYCKIRQADIILTTSFIILYYYQQMHNYFRNYHTPTYFDIIMSSSGSL